MNTVLQQPEATRFELKPRTATVVDVDRVTADFVKMRVAGEDLADFQTFSPSDHVKLVLPNPGFDAPLMPVKDGDKIQWPGENDVNAIRDYTPMLFENGELTFGFVVHGDGPASAWADRAQVGDVIGILGPRGSRPFPANIDWLMIVGDSSVVPALNRAIAEYGASTPIHAVMEVGSAADEATVASPAQATVHFVHRSAGQSLVDVVKNSSLPTGNGYIYVAGETTDVIAIRRYFVAEAGVPKERVNFSGYWRRGVADWDHHEPLDVD